jgi:hypothetical protein
LTVAGEKHPADEIGRALSQAGGILASLANCYDESVKNFETAPAFIAEALKAVDAILEKANTNLATLYQDYDLARVIRIETPSMTEEANRQSADSAEIETREVDAVNLGYFGRQQNTSRFTALPEEEPELTNEEMIDQPAQSYEELFQKLTAMTIAAAQDHSLLPVLESLRQDVERLRNAV